MADTTIQDRARALKASKLVEQLHIAGATASVIPYLGEDAWTQAAQAVGVRAPSDRTRALVRRWFVEREQPPAPEAIRNTDRLLAKGRDERKRDADPFDGLDDAA